MPRLDGATATRAIRATEHATGRVRVPVIAVSAHRKVELTAAEAGMDGDLSKPIDIAALTTLLSRAGAGELEGPIDHHARLARVGGRTELARTIAATFLLHQPTMMAPIDDAISQNNAVELHRAAHGLRGALAMIGAQRAAESAGTLEHASLTEAARLRDRLVDRAGAHRRRAGPGRPLTPVGSAAQDDHVLAASARRGDVERVVAGRDAQDQVAMVDVCSRR